MWQISGLPCVHALYLIGVFGAEIDQYVHEYYSVARFNATYTENVPSLEAKNQWEAVNPTVMLSAPGQTRAPVRPQRGGGCAFGRRDGERRRGLVEGRRRASGRAGSAGARVPWGRERLGGEESGWIRSRFGRERRFTNPVGPTCKRRPA